MPIKRRGVVLSEPRGRGGGGLTATFYWGVREPPREIFEIGVLAKKCISMYFKQSWFCSFVKEKQFHGEKHTCNVLC